MQRRISPEPIHVLYYRLGEVWRAQEQWNKAAQCYRQAIAHQSDYLPAHSHLAVVLQYQGQHEDAVDAYHAALALDPTDASLHNNLARSLAHLNRIHEAIAAYERAITLKPEFVLAHHNLARLWHRQGYYREAIASFQTVLKLQPQQSVYSEAGMAWLALGEPQRAIAYLRQAILPQQAFIKAYCYLYQTSNDPSSDDPLALARIAGIQFLNALLAADPTATIYLANAYRHWGDLLMKDGGRSQQQQAERLYTRAVQFNPQLAGAYHGLSNALSQQYRLAAAVFVQQYANALAPSPSQTSISDLKSIPSPKQIPQGEEALSACAGLNCPSCLQAIAQSYAPRKLNTNTYELAGRGWPAEPQPQDILTLHHGRSWAAPYQNVWKICNGIAVFDRDGTRIESRSREYPGQLPNCTEAPLVDRARLADQYPIEPLSGRVAVISGLSGHVYFHWMVDILPRLDLLRQQGIEPSELDAIVVNSQQHPFQRETLRLFGVREDQIVESDRHPHIQAEELIVPPFPGSLGWATLETIQSLRDRILTHVSTTEAYPERLYISRADASYRQVLNEKEITQRLAAEGFVSLCLAGRSVVEQAALFAHANVVVAPHGSSLTNLVFCRPGTVVVELTSPHYVRPYYWEISRLLGLHHLVVYAEVLGCDAVRQVMSPNPLTEDLWITDAAIDAILAYLSTERSSLPAPIASSQRVYELPMLPYLKDAIATCEKAFQTQTDVFQTSRTLGNVLQAQGLFDEAMVWHTLAVHPAPNLAEVYNHFGRLYSNQQYWNEAIAAFQNALVENAEYAEAHWGLADLHGKLGNAEAEVHHRQQAIALQPQWQTAESHFLLGNAYLAKQSTADAIAAYQEAVNQRPDFLEAHYNLGTALLQAERYQEAAIAYRSALQLDDTHALSYHGLGSALEAVGDLKGAIQQYQHAVSHDPKFFAAYQQLGNALKKQKRWPEAAEAFQRVVELNPDFPWGHHSLGVAYLSMNQPQTAIPHLKNAVQLKPEVDQLHITLGNALARVGRVDEAIATYKQVLGSASEADIHLCQLGQMLRKQGYSDAAVVCYQQAIATNPMEDTAYFRLQYMPIKPHQLPRLITFYRQIQASGREFHPLLWSNLGDALTRNKQSTEAINAYRQGCYASVTKSYPQLAQVEWPSQKKQPPHFIIIGATKCGTTSLHQYLKYNTYILPPQRKEIDFFVSRNFHLGKEWYLSQFPSITDLPGYYTGEASPHYLDAAGVEQHMHDLFPNMKLITLLRNPIDRALSAYHHLAKDGIEVRTLEKAIIDEINELSVLTEEQIMQRNRSYQSIVFGGLYVYKLKRWMSVFPKEQMLILKSEDFFKNTEDHMQRVYDFLGIPSASAPQYGKHNAGSYSVENKEIRDKLRDFFQPHTTQLEDYLGVEFGWE